MDSPGTWEWEPLQQEYGVGRDTVLHALQLLRDAGLIFAVAKRGSYVGHQS